MNGAPSAACRFAGTAVERPLTPARCAALLQTWARTRALAKGELLHARLITSGLLSSAPSGGRRRRLLLPKLASMYALCGEALPARRLFDDILPERRTPFLFNTLIRAYLQERFPLDALHLFRRMTTAGCRPDKFTFTFALKACADLSRARGGDQLHCAALAAGLASDGYVQNSLIAMYMSCGEAEEAEKVFEGMRERTIVSWNTMIAGLLQNGRAAEAAALYDRMTGAGVDPDCATVVSVLPACAALRDLERGRRVHLHAKQKGFLDHAAVKNSLIDMYAKGGSLAEARQVFDEGSCSKDVVSWTAMIGGYALQERSREALALSRDMLLSGTRPNAVTMVSLLSACTRPSFLRHGKTFHGSCLRLALVAELAVETALIDMYGKCGGARLSSSVFSTGSRRTATWNAMMSSFSQNNLPREAVELFRLMMRSEASRADSATIVSLLPAYSLLADLRQAGNIHGHLIRAGFDRRREVATGLIDLYAKAGNLEAAQELFNGIPAKDTVAWSAIIAGYGTHGRARDAAALFERMLEAGAEPNEVTFTSLLYSCSHAGMVDEGLSLFNRALCSGTGGVGPRAEHYAGAVDLLGRAGRLQEARGLIAAMPCSANHAVWGALLGACVIHGDVHLGEEAAGHLFELEPENTGNYVLLGNIYSAAGRWEDAEKVRRVVRERGLKKLAGCSLVETARESEETNLAM